jgi:hypothetical protein
VLLGPEFPYAPPQPSLLSKNPATQTKSGTTLRPTIALGIVISNCHSLNLRKLNVAWLSHSLAEAGLYQ